jgi:hypothetical protein
METCNKSYGGQTGSSIEIRHREHTRIRYIKTNNPISAYAIHIINNRYGYPEHTMQLLKGKRMNCWVSFYMHMLQQQNLLIDEQKTNKPNPLYAAASITKVTRHTTGHPLRLSTRQTSAIGTSTTE